VNRPIQVNRANSAHQIAQILRTAVMPGNKGNDKVVGNTKFGKRRIARTTAIALVTAKEPQTKLSETRKKHPPKVRNCQKV
jgi:hypothetical protein